MKPDSLGVPGVVVGLLSVIDGDYVPSYVRGEDFERYLAWLREHDPDRLQAYAGTFERRELDSVAAVEFASLDLLKALLADMVARGFATQEIAYHAVDPASPAVTEVPDAEREKMAAAMTFVDAYIAEREQELRELCGGRICHKLEDGRMIYRTDTHDPPMWYFDDGRLAPRELWRK